MKHTIEVRIKRSTLEKHTLITGGSGSGKSVLLSNICHSIITSTNKKRDCSLILIEPHSDLATLLMSDRAIEDDRLLYISSTIQKESGEAVTPIFNPFQVPKDADNAFKNLLATQLSSAIAEMIETSQHGISLNMEMLLRPCILVTLNSPNPCMQTLKKFFTPDNSELIALGCAYPHVQIQSFFKDLFMLKTYDATRAAILSKLNFFLNDTALYDVLNGNGVDIEQCMDEGKIIIVNAPRGANPFIASLIGRLMIAYVFCIALRRQSQNIEDRKQTYLIVDEVGSYMTSSLYQSLQEARKYKLALILSLQSTKMLDLKMRSALMTNTFLKCISVCDGDSRALYSKEMIDTTADDLARLEPLMFMVSMSDGKTKPFRIRTKFLHKHLFLNKHQIKERLAYQIKNSGVYKPIPAPPSIAPTPPSINQVKPLNKQKKTSNENPFDGSLPAF